MREVVLKPIRIVLKRGVGRKQNIPIVFYLTQKASKKKQIVSNFFAFYYNNIAARKLFSRAAISTFIV